MTPLPANAVAIVGMAGRFPGAENVAAFWRNLMSGIESISRFGEADLEDSFDAATRARPNFVRARPLLDGVDLFDASFFGILPREAAFMDPQQRILLECAWEALEDAGYEPGRYDGSIGVFAGATTSTYLLQHLCPDRATIEDYTSSFQVGHYPTLLGSAADFTATRIAYKLGLTGPAIAVQSACSTSLLAVAQAAQSLLGHGCDMALAGGASITFPQRRGYLAQEGGMVSTDGRCRPFDAKANGTVFGSGAGLVLLKRLEDAVADRDHIYAVIRGVGVNNDGADKVGFTAPSIAGQAAAIAMAHAAANVEARSIGYVECHGTGTPMGDPIEVAGLAAAFRTTTADEGFCALGSVKSNIGHLDVAAGVAGLIKAALAVESGEIPATLHLKDPNPRLEIDGSPFTLASTHQRWSAADGPRRAGVSAFGVGGTNVHLVLEQAPERPRRAESAARPHILTLAARSEAGLGEARARLARHLESDEAPELGDVAYTLQTGRRSFEHRCAIACRDRQEGIAALRGAANGLLFTGRDAGRGGDLVFMFPGQGSQYPQMARELYAAEPVFRQAVDRCVEILRPFLGFDLRDEIYPTNGGPHAERLATTRLAQPAIFTIEYALSQLLLDRGLRPAAMIGHSIGEFTAACLAGVFSLEDALSIVATRGRLMQEMPQGAMLAVRAPEAKLADLIGADLSIAAVNAPGLVVCAGPFEAIEALEATLLARSLQSRRLQTSHAFHSAMMDGLIDPLVQAVAAIELRAPQLPYVSGVTGTWITDAEATSPAYWARHARASIRFADMVATVVNDRDPVFLEVGPGSALSAFVLQGAGKGRVAASCLPSPTAEADATFAAAIARLWIAGIAPDWAAFHADAPCKVPLPTYPFERSRHWVEAPSAASSPAVVPEPGNPQLVASPEQDPTMSASVAERPVSRQAPSALKTRLAAIFEALSGRDIGADETASTFLELGFDSLLLTQAAQDLHTHFGIRVGFRQLLDELACVDDLANHIAATLPPEALQVPDAPGTAPIHSTPVAVVAAAPVVATLPSVVPAGAVAVAGDTQGLGGLMRDQLAVMSRLMEQQLQALGGLAAASYPAQSASPAAMQAPIVLASQEARAPTAPLQASPVAPASAPAEETAQTAARTRVAKLVKTSASGAMTQRQRDHVARLQERYCALTASSKRLTAERRAVLADPRTVAGFTPEWKEMVYPIVAARAKGARIWDVDGNTYIDLVNGYGQTAFGHAPDFVVQAVSTQLEDGFAIGPQSPLAGEAAALFCDLTGHDRVAFCNTGSEAVMAALRVARTVTGRDRVATFGGDYHGQFDEVLVRGVGAGDRRRTLPASPGVPAEAVNRMTVLDYGTPESLAWLREHAGDLAAVLIEPVQSRHPGLVPAEFLREVRVITERSGTALILDEVVTGFRVHPAGVQGLLGIRPDLATYGKIVGGGLPVGLLAGSARFMDALDGGGWSYGDDSVPEVGVTFFAGTFVRHPLTLAAVTSVLRHVRDQGENLYRGLTANMDRFAASLRQIFAEAGWDLAIESYGSLLYFEPGRDNRFGSLLPYHLRMRGVFVQEHYPCFLTTEHREPEIAAILAAFRDSLAEMRADGMLPMAAGVGAEAASATPVAFEIPLTEAQTEVWLSAQAGPEASAAFTESVSLTIEGPLDMARLAKAVRDVAARHEVLRASFSPAGETMRVEARADLRVSEIDLRNAPDPEAALHQRISERAGRAFDLVEGPVAEAEILRVGTDRHVLVFSAHHIVCDGWSINVFAEEVSAAYRAGAGSLQAPMTFRAYADLSSADERAAKSEAYWAEIHRDLPPSLELPTDRPRPAMRSFRGGTLVRHIDADLYREVKQAGAKRRKTLFATLLATYGVLMSRLAEQADVVVGIPAAGQTLYQGGPLVGHCVNFLPVRTTIDPARSFADHLDLVGNTLLDAYDHQCCTLGTILRKVRVPPRAGRLPLVEVEFNLERLASGLDFGAGLKARLEANHKSFSTFDIFLNVVESDAGLRLECHYNSDIFESATIDRWLGHYRALLRAFVADPQCQIGRMSLEDAGQRERLLAEINRTQADFPLDEGVLDAFAAAARANPDAIALSCGGRSVSYAELDAWSNRVAAAIVARLPARESRVAVLVERSAALVAAMLGALKAGRPYVPLSLSMPEARIRTVLEDSGAGAILTVSSDETSGLLRDNVIPTIAIDRLDGTAPPILSAATPDDLAYVIYTSGSTGRPKGVEVTRRGLSNLLFAMAREPGFERSDVLLAVTTVTFDIAALELLLPLTRGGRVVIASGEEARDGEALLTLLAQSRATVMQATPMTWRLLLEAGMRSRPGFRMLCGGEALPLDLARRLLEGGGELWNMYGPTETTIWSSIARIEPTDDVVTIGRPIANTQFYVVDAQDQPAPVGVPGELLIGGIGLARGYAGNPSLTAKCFVASPIHPDRGDRVYRTGDRVQLLADGRVQHLGRLDHQIKLNGFRIEPGEIEAVLARKAGLVSAVILREDVPGEPRLVCYFVAPEDGSHSAEPHLRQALAAELPDYMVPQGWVAMKALPRNASGKLDRAALPPPGLVPAAPAEPTVQSRTPLEDALLRICGDILRRSEIGVDDDLFSLGLDSLGVFQITSRARKEGVQLAARDLFRNRTIARLAAALPAIEEAAPAQQKSWKLQLRRPFRSRSASGAESAQA